MKKEEEIGTSKRATRLILIVPFRDMNSSHSQGLSRLQNLAAFLPYMTRFLKKNSPHLFHIAIIEQSENLEFNKGALMNVC